MRSALTKIDGVSDIETDIPSRICTFKLANNDLDIEAKLDELGESNTHIAGWSMAAASN